VFKYDGKNHLVRHHLYVCVAGSDELTRHLAFRDRLRSHPDDRMAYGLVKEAAARRHPADIDAYMEEKNGIIRSILKKTIQKNENSGVDDNQ
jgi:GrpB-like predicted nucleotidyltransferase (UPF0157 family)